MEMISEYLNVINDNIFVVIFLMMICGLCILSEIGTSRWIVKKIYKKIKKMI